MSQPELPRLEQLFQAAADLPAAERPTFVAQSCGDDAALRRRLMAMLAELERDQSLAPALVTSAGGELPSLEGPGATIGRYKLLQILGEGGFGVVYMAEQQEPVQRKVALKIIKLGMDTREVVARFEAERQALAMMDHPNIARVLDGGATDAGRPYFVMELVRGVSITDYCDQNRVATRERLRLFQEVCHAVQHAHQKGVIHRDLKPSNVMVTLHDGRPVPKVIDFGIVKAMHTRLTEKTLFTEYHRFIGTPAYMSPEQAEMSGLDIDTRTDIYALGVLLYELLTGSTPFDTAQLMASGLGEVQRVIREEPPQRPSMRISAHGTAAIAQQRGIEPGELSRRLRGDLDWIVMKALEKERGRRYATASEFAADVQRHLDFDPVTAGAPSRIYRARKYVARNRTAVVAAALVMLALVLGVIGTALALVEAAAQRDAARRETANARMALDFLADTLALADPEVALSPDLSVRTLLSRAGERVGAFADNPRAEATVRATIGQAFNSLGEHQAADRQLRRADELFSAMRAPDPELHYNTLWTLTHVAFKLDRDDGMTLAHRARQLGHARIAETDAELAQAIEAFVLATQEADVATARDRFTESMQRADAVLPPSHPHWLILADSLMAGGFSMWYTPAEGETAPFLAKAHELRRRLLGEVHPDVNEALAQLVGVLSRSGRAGEAEQHIRRSLAALRQLHPDGHWQVGFAQSMLGECLHHQGQFEAAERELLAAHELLTVEWDEHSFYGFDSFYRLTALYDSWERPEPAGRFRAALRRSQFSMKHVLPWTITKTVLGPELRELEEALDQLRQRCGGGPFGIGPLSASDSAASVAGIEAAAQAVIAARRAALADDDDLGALIGRNLATWATALPPDAALVGTRRALADEVEALLQHHVVDAPLELAAILALRADLAAADGEAPAGQALARRAADVLTGAAMPQNWVTAGARLRIAESLLTQGLHAEAEALATKSLAVLEGEFGPAHKDVHAARAIVARIYTSWGNPDRAAEFAPHPTSTQENR
ncbi:MAG: protein kinase [Planctomycetota bacterium]